MNIVRNNKLLFCLLIVIPLVYFAYDMESETSNEKINEIGIKTGVLNSKQNTYTDTTCSSTSSNPFGTAAPCRTNPENKPLFPHASMNSVIDELVAGDNSKYEAYYQYSLRCRYNFSDSSNLQQRCDPKILAAHDAKVLRFAEDQAEKGDVQAQVLAAKIWYLEALSPALGDGVASGGESWKPKALASF